MPRKHTKREILLLSDDVKWFFKECPNESLNETMRRLLSAYRKECTYNTSRERIMEAAQNVRKAVQNQS